MITLHSGPYNKRRIHDSGTVLIRMSLIDRSQSPPQCGEAHYVPSPDRRTAHWEGNLWFDETLVEEIE